MKIIFFDGVCGLCNHFVDFVMARDKNQTFKFSPLQGKKAQELLSKEMISDLDSVVFYDDGKITRKSEAVFEIFKLLGPPWSLLAMLQGLPQPLSDGGYDLVANSRYALFGKKDSCRIPTPQERARFID